MSYIIYFIFSILFILEYSFAEELNSINLLNDKNSHVYTLKGYGNTLYHRYAKDTHIKDGSGSIELIGHHSSLAIKTPTFKCDEGKHYLFSAYLKNSKFPKGQNIVFSILQGGKHLTEGYWNSSTQNKWEEVLLTFIPSQSNTECYIKVYTYKRSFSLTSTDDLADTVDMLGKNLNRKSKVYLDDFSVREYNFSSFHGQELPSPKTPFESSIIKVSIDGDFYVKKSTGWQYIFPKLIYRSKKPQYQAYKKYGFNGLMDVWNVGQIKEGLNAGLEYFVVDSNIPHKVKGDYRKRVTKMLKYIYSEEISKPYSLLMYNYDNENSWLQDDIYKENLTNIIHAIDSTATQQRNRPIYMLNGNIGVARAYKNNHLNQMDITGTYVGGDSLGYLQQKKYPYESFALLKIIENQTAPVSVIQLQSFLDKKLIPSLFYGLIQGGKAISIWRDGGSEKNFQNYTWAEQIKKVFKQIDKMAPLLEGNKVSSWFATTKNNWINLGARTVDGKHYLIISNHSSSTEMLHIKIKKLPNVYKIKDYFSNKTIATVKKDSFNLIIDYDNKGYSVVELILKK